MSVLWSVALLAVCWEYAPSQNAVQLVPDDVAAARNRLVEYLKGIRGASEAARIVPLEDKDFLQAFPHHLLFGVSFPQYPVARIAPPPLSSANLIAVPRGKEGQPIPITTMDQWRDFVSKHAIIVRDTQRAEQLARVFLRGASELHQDGFFRFTIEVEPARSSGDKSEMITVQGRARVDPKNGDKGDIRATLSFTDGRLVTSQIQVQLSAGIRPICQAARLLDPDPVVRRLAEDTLRLLGRDVGPYLEEQRRRASPELRQAIDRLWQRILEEDR